MPWSKRSLTEIVAHVVGRFHAKECEELHDLVRDARRAAHERPCNELRRLVNLLIEVQSELLAHMLKEERVLFPYLLRLDGTVIPEAPAFGSVRNPVSVMRHDHDRVVEQIRQIRRVSAGLDSKEPGLFSSIESFCVELGLHIRFENDVLFPRALELEHSLR